MHVLIIGGTGFIGPSVVHSLVDKGHHITIYHRGQNEVDLPSGVRHIHCAQHEHLPGRLGWIERLPDYVHEFRHIAPDVVLYMTPFGEEDTRIVVDAFKGLAQRIVAISSQDVYRAYGRLQGSEPGPPDPVPLTEESPLREKLYPYRGETPREQDDPRQIFDNYDKILVERLIMSDPTFPGTMLRLPMVYGPRDNQHRLFDYLKRMDDQRPAILLDERLAQWRWTRGYVEDVAEAIALAVSNDRAAGRIYNVGEPDALTMSEWVQAIGDAVGWQERIVTVPSERLPAHLTYPIDASQDLVTDTTRIRQELAYHELFSRNEALKRTIAWERTNPPQEIELRHFDYAEEDAILRELK